ncbi:MAG TPA: hypothetical protein VER08_01165 [Pyrinomonadaceae bacterium]|nr:hypothetical protein [Pyrinomonadaceae bacterium]
MRPAGDTTEDAKRDRGGAAGNFRTRDDVEEAGLSNVADEEDDAVAPREGEGAGRHVGAPSRVIDALPGSPQLWSTVCVACLIVSAALVLNGRAEAAFVTATLGVLAWFINVRNRLRDDEAETRMGRRGEQNEKQNPHHD